MEQTSASSIISALGGGSGIDFIQLAQDVSAASFAAQRGNLDARTTTLEARISATSQLRSSLTTLASSFGDRIRFGDLAPTANLGNSSVARVSTTPGVVPDGSYSLEVSQLADSQTLVTPAFASPDELVGAGTLTLRFGTVAAGSFTADAQQAAIDIAVDASDTVTTLAAKINAASGSTVEAYVAQGTSGAQIVLKGADGAQNGFVLEAASAGGSGAGDLSFLAWNPASDTGQLRSTAQDAEYSLDTVAFSSASNTITGLPEGISLELTGLNIGAPTTLSFSTDPNAVTSVMNDFVTALNELADQVNEVAAAQGGTLGNDPGARELKRDLAALAGEIVMPSAGEGEPQTLGDLGLGITREGRFQLDTDRLSAALSASPSGVSAMFTTGPFGVFATIDGLARDNTSRSAAGSLGASLVRYEGQLEANAERLETVAEQQETLRARLATNFVAAERAINSSQSTLGFLQQQIEAWNNSNS